MHSYYVRRPRDLLMLGHRVEVRAAVRRACNGA
ncbi:MAG: hypothetical protein GX492_10740 [Firmicutes bacterium]|nr:hypothetical protein [Bacillota bacterium]